MLFPSTRTDALSPRLDTLYDQAFLPVRAWNAVTDPSPEPVMTSRSPLMTDITGVWYGASTGMPPVPLLQRNSPVFLSKQKTRYWLLAWSPQPNATPPMKSWSSSIAGVGVRPPNVEIIPNSSDIDRFHASLPVSASSAVSIPWAPYA